MKDPQFVTNISKSFSDSHDQQIYVVLDLHNCIPINLNVVLDLHNHLIITLKAVLDCNEPLQNINFNDVSEQYKYIVINLNVVLDLYKHLRNIKHKAALNLINCLCIIGQL